MKLNHSSEIEELKLKIENVKHDHLNEIDLFEQEKSKFIEIEQNEKKYLKDKLEELKNKIESVRNEKCLNEKSLNDRHLKTIEEIRKDHKMEIENLQGTNQSLVENHEKYLSEFSNIKHLKKELEIELKKADKQISNLNETINEYSVEKDHLKDLIRLDFENELQTAQTLKDSLEKNEMVCADLKSQLEKSNHELEMTKSLNKALEEKLLEKDNRYKQLRYSYLIDVDYSFQKLVTSTANLILN